MRTCAALGLAALIVALSHLPGEGADWPQWRGPDRTGVSQETGLLEKWPKNGPNLLWTFKKAGTGYSSFAVVKGVVYTMGARGKDEYVIAIDDKGVEKWATKIGPVYDFKGNQWIKGPNAAPTVDGDLVFALSSKGELACVDKAGKLIWRVDLVAKLGAQINPVGGGPKNMGWGFAWSPLVDGNKLICTPGGPQGLFAALDKKKGNVLWRSKGVTDQATYASPVLATINKVRQYITVTQDSILGVSAEDGTLLWRSKRDNPFPDVVCCTPIVQGNKVSVSIGYNVGSILLELTPDGKKFKVKDVYSEPIIGNRHGGVVLVGKSLYGFHEENNWVCQDFATGAQKWKGTRKALKSGAVIAADKRLYIVDEAGFVGMVATGTPKYQELARFKLPARSRNRMSRGSLWTHPALSDGKLYVRDQELIFCYQVK
jgi:outer membrane protein assembly factor BamB